MALFTDGYIASLADLRACESAILDVASAEGIDLGAKLELAQRELEREIVAFLLRRGQLSGVRRELDHVVVTEPLLHAHTMTTLSLIYRDACNSQLNDRFEGRWKQYAALAARAVRQLFEIGVGMTCSPIPKSQPPSLTLLLGGYQRATTYTVRCAAAGAGGATGAHSDAVIRPATPGQTLEVALPKLPAGALGWVLYVADADGPLCRQNAGLLPDGATWTCPSDGIRTDLALLPVQGPDYFVINRQEILRG